MINTIKHESMRIAGKKVDAENKIDVLYPYTNVTMWTPCGFDVDSSPHPEHVVVYQMWTQCGLDVDPP